VSAAFPPDDHHVRAGVPKTVLTGMQSKETLERAIDAESGRE
jgi:hypothetical protein